MIPRRARIKGIANIPVRRKTEVLNQQNIENSIKPEPPCLSENQNVVATDSQNVSNSETTNNTIIKSEHLENITCSQVKETSDSQSETTNSVEETSNIQNETKNPVENNSSDTNETKLLNRRWNIKPKPIITSIFRRPKPNLIQHKQEKPELNNQNIENVKPICLPQDNTVCNSQPGTSENSATITDLTTHILNNSTTEIISHSSTESSLKSSVISEPNISTPLSSNKINRARIRPTPKLIRRNSIQGSASESEDDSKRSYNRIRNDSVCSTTSHTTDTKSVDNKATTHTMIVSMKKFHRQSAPSRKIIEAKKEFFLKFGNRNPDRKRLKMQDFIYYNPACNPMPQLKPDNESTLPIKKLEEEEKIDDPENLSDDSKSDEECTPVPQVKVGPNGEIILDEQSLVIEQTGTKKGRAQLANSEVINGDDLNRSYGIYKRPKRGKEWTAIETLRFYRTLNTIGTDFSLMETVFPDRSRRELKKKFKKEEKLNLYLVDRALHHPIDFDLTELEQQAKEEERILAQQKEMKLKKRNDLLQAKNSSPKSRKPARSKFAKIMDEETHASNIAKIRPKRKNRKDIYSVLENGLNDIIESESDSNEEYTPAIRKLKRKTDDSQNSEILNENSNHSTDTEDVLHNPQDIGINLTINEETNLVEIYDENQYEEETPTMNENDLNKLEPGSLMIVSSVNNGETVFKVYVVNLNQDKIELNLSADIIQELALTLGSEEAVNLDLPVIHAENINEKNIDNNSELIS